MNRSLKLFCSCSLLALLLTGCGGSKAAAMLNEFDKAVTVWEQKSSSGEVTIGDVNDLNKATTDMAEKVKAFQASGEKMSESDMKRYADITARMSQAMMKMSQNMKH